MNNQFDELTKGLAQSVTRRAALKKFGVGLAGMALACFGLANKAKAAQGGCKPSGQRCGRGSNVVHRTGARIGEAPSAAPGIGSGDDQQR